MKISKAFYCFHPDYVQDENEPKGYKILSTGLWVVEWDEVETLKKQFSCLPNVIHKRMAFNAEKEAKRFWNAKMKHMDKDRQEEVKNSSYRNDKKYIEMLRKLINKKHLGI